MMNIPPEPPTGSEQWRDGWVIGYEQCQIDSERDHPTDHDGPRTWAIEYPPAPPAGTRVTDRHGTICTVGPNGYVNSPSVGDLSWREALSCAGPLTEVVETEVQAAARRLREHRIPRPGALIELHRRDVETVLRHVLSGGQL